MIPLHDAFSAKIELIGYEKEPVIVIDNFLSDPDALVRHAVANKRDFTRDTEYYPGVRIPATLEYVESAFAHLKRLIAEVFKLPQSGVQGQAFYSMVTVPPAQLDFKQRIPHYDIPDRAGIAMMHFLCPDTFGGTSFYRHRTTGFEFIDQTRVDVYSDVLNREIKKHGLPGAAYIDGDTVLFERILSYGAAFNRALVYRSSSLHSGDIGPDYAGDADPGTGRLSVTSFFRSGG